MLTVVDVMLDARGETPMKVLDMTVPLLAHPVTEPRIESTYDFRARNNNDLCPIVILL
jgi:hypothetical protein